MKYTRQLLILIIFALFLPAAASAQEANKLNEVSNATQKTFSHKGLFEVNVGYANKSWRCTYKSGSYREDFFGDSDDKFLHGASFGAVFTPAFSWGLGLRVGAFMEAYNSHSKWITDWCDHYQELDLYFPMHASYNFKINEKMNLTIYGGMGLQWAVDGSYVEYAGSISTSKGRRPRYKEVAKQEFGNGWPQKTNWQAEAGIRFTYDRIGLGFTYSFGVVDHGIQNTFDEGLTYETSSKSRQDKMNAFFIFTF